MRPTFRVAGRDDLNRTVTLELVVSNEGTRSADGFTWQCGLKREGNLSLQAFTNGQLMVELKEIEGVDYWWTHWRVETRLYRKREGIACQLLIGGYTFGDQLTLLSQLAWDEGEYPGGGYHTDVITLDGEPFPPSFQHS